MFGLRVGRDIVVRPKRAASSGNVLSCGKGRRPQPVRFHATPSSGAPVCIDWPHLGPRGRALLLTFGKFCGSAALPGALAFAADRQERSQVLFEIPVGVHGDVDCEMCCGICGGNQQDHFAAAREFAQKLLGVEKPPGPAGFRVVADQVPLERVLGLFRKGCPRKKSISATGVIWHRGWRGV